jgi:hypothetical protein
MICDAGFVNGPRVSTVQLCEASCRAIATCYVFSYGHSTCRISDKAQQCKPGPKPWDWSETTLWQLTDRHPAAVPVPTPAPCYAPETADGGGAPLTANAADTGFSEWLARGRHIEQEVDVRRSFKVRVAHPHPSTTH